MSEEKLHEQLKSHLNIIVAPKSPYVLEARGKEGVVTSHESGVTTRHISREIQ